MEALVHPSPLEETPRLCFDDLYRISNGADYGYPESTTAAIRSEDPKNGWVVTEGAPTLGVDRETIKQLGKRHIICPMCGYDPFTRQGDKEVWVPATGKNSGVRILYAMPCTCVYYENFYRLWIPLTSPMYEDIALDNLKTPTIRKASEDQKRILSKMNRLIEKARQAPDKSFTILGPSRVGKSAIGQALMRAACQRRAEQLTRNPGNNITSIWSITAERLFDEHHRFVMGYDIASGSGDGSKLLYEPTVTARGIERASRNHLRPFLLLDELDKVSMTAPRLKVLSAIIDAMTNHNGQLVVLTNLRGQGLRDLVGEANWGERGNAIFERLTMNAENTSDNIRSHFVDLYDPNMGSTSKLKESPVADSGSKENPVADSEYDDISFQYTPPAPPSPELVRNTAGLYTGKRNYPRPGGI